MRAPPVLEKVPVLPLRGQTNPLPGTALLHKRSSGHQQDPPLPSQALPPSPHNL